MLSQAIIRPIVPEDISVVSAIYATVFPNLVPAVLGQEVISRYCHWLLTELPGDFCLGAEVDGELAGFCFAGAFRDVQSDFIRKNRLLLLRRVALRPWLVVRFRPSSLALSMRALLPWSLKRKRLVSSPHAVTPRLPLWIYVLAVHPGYQRRGTGGLLMREIESAAIAGGFEEIRLGVDPENVGTLGFYKHLGFHKAPTSANWTLCTMVKRLNC